MKRIAVLMTCYNRVDTTLECLQRLFNQEMPEGYSFDVWLVDDASPDKTGETVKAAYPQVNVIQGTGKLFWCKGMRLAWDKAAEAYDYDFYLWLNDDVMLIDGAVASVIKDVNTIIADNEIGIVVGTCCSDGVGKKLSYGCRGDDGTIVSPVGSPLKVHSEAMSGNFVMIPKHVYEVVGPIYDGYSHAFGDRDYSIMLKRVGGSKYISSRMIGICPQEPERYFHLDGLSLFKRISLLYSPKGFPLKDTFILRYRQKNLVRAWVSCLHVIWRVIFAYKGF